MLLMSVEPDRVFKILGDSVSASGISFPPC
jgi:hypothetical protein